MNEDYITQAHVAAVKKAIEEGELPLTDTVGIEMLNMENFKFKLKNRNGLVSIGEMIELKKFVDSALSSISHMTHTILYHDKKSPHYWGKIEEREYEGEKKHYVVSLNLEKFMHDDSQAKEVFPGCVIPDNYTLAKNAIKVFEDAGNDIKDIEEDSFRDLAVWHIKSKKQAQKLVKFIDDTYVIPEINRLMEIGNIKKVNYKENQFEFVFNKRRKIAK